MDAIQGLTMGAENKIGVHFTEDVFAPEASGYYQVGSDEAPGASSARRASNTGRRRISWCPRPVATLQRKTGGEKIHRQLLFDTQN